MTESGERPDLKRIVGALIFGADRALTVNEMRKCLKEVAADGGDDAAVFADVTPGQIRAALDELGAEFRTRRCGILLSEIAGGFCVHTDPACGPWMKNLLDLDQPQRLSQPALETLAIIAYRQPIARSEIESIRGVSVDHVVRSLLEMQLIRIVGRSELPGRPFLYGTTHAFLEQFGLRDLSELSELEPMLTREFAKQTAAKTPAAEPPGPAGDDAEAPAEAAGEEPETEGDDDDDDV